MSASHIYVRLQQQRFRDAAAVTYLDAQTSSYSYLPVLQDLRLEIIHHQYPGGATLSKFDYTYDITGNILTWRQQADSAAALWRYGYDAADQLTQAVKWSTMPTPAVLQRFVYRYDAGGNRTSEQIDDAVTGATHNNRNQLIGQQPSGALTFAGSVSEAATVTIGARSAMVATDQTFRGTATVPTGTSTVTVAATDASGNTAAQDYQISQTGTPRTLTYDANGNLASDGTRTFTWDAVNRLVSVTIGAHVSEFTYNGLSRRVRIVEKTSGVTMRDAQLFWTGAAIIEDRLSNGDISRFFDEGEQHSGVARYLTRDHLGSIRELTDQSDAVVARNEYDPYGRLTRIVDNERSRFGFTGHYDHGSSGLALSLHRAYDPSLGRWINDDPAGMSDGPNLSAYVGNRPITAYDPDGLLLFVLAIPTVVEALVLAATFTVGTFTALHLGETISDIVLSKSQKDEDAREHHFNNPKPKTKAKEHRPDTKNPDDAVEPDDLLDDTVKAQDKRRPHIESIEKTKQKTDPNRRRPC